MEVSRKGENYKLFIRNLKMEDSGQYACKVGERPSKCEIVVEECEYMYHVLT